MTVRYDKKPIGWVFYDADCTLCRRTMALLRSALQRAGYEMAPLQDEWVSQRLGLSTAELLEEMRVLTPDGRLLSGADAAIEVARHVPWLWPLTLLTPLPGAKPLLRRGYRWIAAHRKCGLDACPTPRTPATENRS